MSNSRSNMVIAIDGGAASDKSSTSRELAKHFNLLHVDTGSHYRTVTHALLQAGASTSDVSMVLGLLHKMAFQTRIHGQRAQLEIHGQVPSQSELRSIEVNQAVSTFAALPEVRAALFDYQRSQKQIAEQNNFSGLVMEGSTISKIRCILTFSRLNIYLSLYDQSQGSSH